MLPPRDTMLVLFLGYEGRRAQALWSHLDPNLTIVVIPDPPMKPEWKGRTETQTDIFYRVCPKRGSFAFLPSHPKALKTSLRV